MLNSNTFTIGSTSTKVTFNTPSSGILQKSHSKSKIVILHHNSIMADWVFAHKDEPYLKDKMDNKLLITVLQVMIFESRLIVEIVYNTDLVEPEVK